MTPEESAKLEDRRTAFLDKMKAMQAKMLAQNSGPQVIEEIRQRAIKLVKEALDQMGIMPGQPGADQKAAKFIASLPQEIVDLITGKKSGETQLSSVLSGKVQGETGPSQTSPGLGGDFGRGGSDIPKY